MSFDLFFQSFQNGVPASFSTALVEKGFGPYASDRNPGRWVLRYPNGGFCELFVDAEQETETNFMVARPRTVRNFGERFWIFCNKHQVVFIGPAADLSSPTLP